MISLPRNLARQFRALARKCLNGRTRGLAPSVVLVTRGGARTLFTRTADADLMLTTPTNDPDDVMVVPMSVLEAVEGNSSDSVELSVSPKLEGKASWLVQGEIQSVSFEALLPGNPHTLPEVPRDWHPVPPSFLEALFECGRTAARESSRYALHRLQVRGKTGQIIGTDGKQALLWSGFRLPTRGDRLIPAIPVFGARELASASSLRITATETHLYVSAGAWTVGLPFDATGRFPDVAGVVPRPGHGTVGGIDEGDAVHLCDWLSTLPKGDDNAQAITLDLDRRMIIRSRDESTGAIREMPLTDSTASGPAVQVALDRMALERALALGCRTVRASDSGKPVAFEAEHTTFLTIAIDSSRVVSAVESPSHVPSPNSQKPAEEAGERSIPVKSTDSNGPPSRNGRHEPPASEAPDPLAEAETLRNLLSEAAARAGRLATALRHNRRQKRQLETVMAGLRQLNLGS